ncbi:MAG: 30S ribosomal protein S16 [Elusimicrobia bacterium]|nr:30S ribosomal protein S16 [Elusimicrobiota bacterium]
MAVVLRLQRTGKPKQAHYRVVAIQKTAAAKGTAVEVVGHYHPKEAKAKALVTLDMPRVEHWLKVGAKPSETVLSLIRTAKKAADAPAQ